MFIDYYKILEIEFGVSLDDIKKGYKKQAIKWHPDKNPNTNAKGQMQLINEAYLILKDIEARERYDVTFLRYYKFKDTFYKNELFSDSKSSQEFKINDDIIIKWMNSAKKQAEHLAAETIENFKIGTKAAGKEILERSTGFLIIAVLFSIMFLGIKSCS
jgi:curved DNA-binding protein CbpA